jgi:predicted NAD/FAD-binding protein
MRIAVIGSGISGLAAARRLAQGHQVTVFESGARAGGHTNSVDVCLDGITHPVDTGFLVYNERTYPNLISLFAELGIEPARSDMSFSVSVRPNDFEWCGSNLGTLFAQPSNVLRPAFWKMLGDIMRFNRQASALALGQSGSASDLAIPLLVFLRTNRYSDAFRDRYLLPMAAAIWSCPMERMLEFPLGSFVRFFHNHGLLQLENRPQWFTVPGGARRYVDRILAGLDDVRLATPVRGVRRHKAGVTIRTDGASEDFNHVVLACHSNQSLALLEDPCETELQILRAVPYQPNRAWLHTDSSLMPRRRRAWAAWNYLTDGRPGSPAVSVTYWSNRLQPLPFRTQVFVSLNPLDLPDPARVIATFDYEHPMFDTGSTAAQECLRAFQGSRNTWFAGAWTGFGFHEDGLKSGLAVAEALDALPALQTLTEEQAVVRATAAQTAAGVDETTARAA